MTILLLVRHGTTEWIEQGKLHGISDSPLSAKGRHEAERAASALKGQHFDAFYTSPLGRARETADIIGNAVKVEAIPLENLREMDFGWMEGGRNFNFAKDPPLIRTLRSGWISMVVNFTGEGRANFGRRVSEAALEIGRRHPDQKVMAVVHMGVRNNILTHLVDHDPRVWTKYDGWPACAFTEIELTPDGSAKIIRLSVDDHLKS